MFKLSETACPSVATVQRIASARLTPYVADTLQNWSREALEAPQACVNLRPDDCEACRTLREIATLPWTERLGEQIQELARRALGLNALRAVPVPITQRKTS